MSSGSDYISLEAPLVSNDKGESQQASWQLGRPMAALLLSALGFAAVLYRTLPGASSPQANAIEVPRVEDIPKLLAQDNARRISGCSSELPGFKDFYMKKNNLKSMTRITPTELSQVCSRTTTEDAVLKPGSILYHGTLVDFSGYPFAPSWFATELPPANKLAMHVPMAWMCFGRGGYTVPGKYWLKKFALKDDSVLPEEKNAATFYNDLSNQAGEAKQFCSCNGMRQGFIIDKDAVDELQETVMCNPERDLDYVTQYVGHSSWDPDDNSKLVLDVGSYGKYSLDCGKPIAKGSFEVIEEPSQQKEQPDNIKTWKDCCSCCIADGGACDIGDTCISAKTGKLSLCNDAGRQHPSVFYGCNA